MDNLGSPEMQDHDMNPDEVGEKVEMVRPLTEELELDTLAYY